MKIEINGKKYDVEKIINKKVNNPSMALIEEFFEFESKILAEGYDFNYSNDPDKLIFRIVIESAVYGNISSYTIFSDEELISAIHSNYETIKNNLKTNNDLYYIGPNEHNFKLPLDFDGLDLTLAMQDYVEKLSQNYSFINDEWEVLFTAIKRACVEFGSAEFDFYNPEDYIIVLSSFSEQIKAILVKNGTIKSKRIEEIDNKIIAAALYGIGLKRRKRLLDQMVKERTSDYNDMREASILNEYNKARVREDK